MKTPSNSVLNAVAKITAYKPATRLKIAHKIHKNFKIGAYLALMKRVEFTLATSSELGALVDDTLSSSDLEDLERAIEDC